MQKTFDKQELKNLFLGAFILGFIFSFREWGYGELNLNIGITNLIRTTILSLIVLLIYQTSHKIIAKRYGAKSTFRVWSFKRFWFTRNSKIENLNFFGKRFKTISSGVIIPIIFAFLSNGHVKFATIGSSEITEIENRRLGKKFKHLTEYELAKIHLAAPLTLLLFAIVFNNITGLTKFVEICYTLALFSMIPFSGLDGAKIFFGSVPLYIFSATFILASVLAMHILTPLLTIILSLIIGITLLISYLHKNI